LHCGAMVGRHRSKSIEGKIFAAASVGFKNEGRGRKSILVEGRKKEKKEDRRGLYQSYKGILHYKIKSKKGHTKEAVLKPFVQKKEMTTDHR
jgi:hypothetical protein